MSKVDISSEAMGQLIADIRNDRTAGTPGRWVDKFDTWEAGWSLDTEGENTVVGIGSDWGLPVAVTAVESAFGKDHVVDANARRIARVPEMEEVILSLGERIKELKASVRTYRESSITYRDSLFSARNDALRELRAKWIVRDLTEEDFASVEGDNA